MSAEEKIKELEARVQLYEQDGVAKLFYSLNRKAGEMADLMNANRLRDIPIDDPKNKAFDRLKAIWSDAASIATAVKQLGDIAGVTGDEEKDSQRKVIKSYSPESIADAVGELAGKRNT